MSELHIGEPHLIQVPAYHSTSHLSLGPGAFEKSPHKRMSAGYHGDSPDGGSPHFNNLTDPQVRIPLSYL